MAVVHCDNRSKPSAAPAAIAINQLNRSINNRLKILFENAHYLCKINRPFTDFKQQAKLNIKQGYDLGSTYLNDKSCSKFVKSISRSELNKLRIIFTDSKFLTLISDGSTDVSVKENEVIYIRHSQLGVAKTLFISMEHVQKADANGIVATLKRSISLLGEFHQLQKKVVVFAADGASVNTGAANGVISKLQNQWGKHIIIIICLAHRLELTYKDALKGDALYIKVITLLNSLYALYHKSPLRREGLADSCKVIICLN